MLRAQLTSTRLKTFLELRKDGDEYQIKVSWLGFPTESDTWEPLAQIYADVPELLESFLKEQTTPMAAQALDAVRAS